MSFFRSAGSAVSILTGHANSLAKRRDFIGIYFVADGKCIVDLAQQKFVSHVEDLDISSGAELVQRECVDEDLPHTTPWGGRARPMGMLFLHSSGLGGAHDARRLAH